MKVESQAFVFGLVVFLFYVPMFFYYLRHAKRRGARRRFYRAIETIVKDTSDDMEAIERIKISYTRLCDIYPHVATSTKSYGDLIEDFCFRVVSLSPQAFKNSYGMEIDEGTRKRLAALVSMFRVAEPYASVSSKIQQPLVHDRASD